VILFFLRFLIFILLTLAFLPFQIIIVFFVKSYSYIIPFLFHNICRRVFGIKIKISGKVANNPPILYVCNHASYLDILILGSIFKFWNWKEIIRFKRFFKKII